MCPFDRQLRTAERVSGRCLGDRRHTGALWIFPPARQGAGRYRGSADGGAGVAAGRKARSIARVIVATDDERIAAPVRAAGGEAMMTSPAHQSGTDRIAEVASKDHRRHLSQRAGRSAVHRSRRSRRAGGARCVTDASIQMATLATPIADHLEWTDPNKVKVVCGAAGNALYFSRSPIPHARDGGMPAGALRHIGVYAYRRDFLMKFAALPMGVLERHRKARAVACARTWLRDQGGRVGGAVARSGYRGRPGARPQTAADSTH